MTYGFLGLTDPSYTTICLEARNQKLIFAIPNVDLWFSGLQGLMPQV